MDGNHAFGCSLVGLALATLLVRFLWMTSPPFNKLTDKGLAAAKAGLIGGTVVLILAGAYLLSLPVDPSTEQRIAEESYQFQH